MSALRLASAGRAPVNARLVAAWRREGISIGGAPASEPQDVWWLQTPSVFADVRIPVAVGASAAAFSGTTVQDGDRLTWHHDLSLHPITGADTGLVHWRDEDTLIESGTALVLGAPVAYEEVWRRATPRGASWEVRAIATGRRVVVGSYALDVSPTGGAAFRHVDGVWTRVGSTPTR
jgi:hypothetical protein